MSKQIITKSSFLQDLEDGLTRKEMATKYEVTMAGISKGIKIFGLENTKPKKKLNVEFIDDTVKFDEVHITQEQIDQKAIQMEEIVNENIQEEVVEESIEDMNISLFGVTPEMMAEAFGDVVTPEPAVEEASQPTFEDLGLPMISNYQD